MFVVTVTLPGAFPFTDAEAFPTVDGALTRAKEWIAWGGAAEAEIRDLGSHAAKEAEAKGLLVGLGRALGYKVTFETAAAEAA